MNTLLEYTDYIKFKSYIKESLDEHMFDEDPGVDFDEHWVSQYKKEMKVKKLFLVVSHYIKDI